MNLGPKGEVFKVRILRFLGFVALSSVTALLATALLTVPFFVAAFFLVGLVAFFFAIPRFLNTAEISFAVSVRPILYRQAEKYDYRLPKNHERLFCSSSSLKKAEAASLSSSLT